MAIDEMQALQEERLKLYEEMKTINEDRSDEWSSDDQEKWDKLEKRYDEVLVEQKDYQRKLDRLAKLSTLNEKIDRQESETRTEIGQSRQERSGTPTEEQKCLALQGWMRHHHGLGMEKRHVEAAAIVKAAVSDNGNGDARVEPVNGWANGNVFYARHQPHSIRRGHERYLSRGVVRPSTFEKRALAVSSEPEVIPEGFSNELSQAMLDWGGMRNVARIVSTASGNDIPWPTGDDTGNTGALLAEATTIGSSVDPTIANITLLAYKYSSKPVLISAELLEDSAFNMAQILGEMLGIRIGRITSTHYATGDNSSKPQGVTVFASAGVTAGDADDVTAEELIQLQAAVDPAWRGNSTWVMNSGTLSEIRQIRESATAATQGNFMWQPGMVSGEPDRLLGAPVAMIQEMPATTTGLVPILYGDMTQYLIRDAGASRFFRLDELYRATDQTGFVMFSRHDGRGLQSGAIKKLTMA